MQPEKTASGQDRRTVLKTLGGSIAGLTGGLSTAGATSSGGDLADIGFQPATIERPLNDARCHFINGTDRSVDIYVNYHPEAYFTLQPQEDQPVFTIDSDANRIYGTYTFEARPKDNPDAEVLAAASVTFEEGQDYTLSFHRVGETDYQMSIYENDFTPSAESRFVIRHNSYHEEIDWHLFTAEHADPRIPEDERSGTLQRGQWQEARDVTENEYRLEIYADGETVAFRQDLELEAERLITCYVVREPEYWMGSDVKEGHIFRHEFQVLLGESREDVTTPPAEPHSTTDTNQTIEFDCEPFSMYETNLTEVEIGATDPDGIVADLGIKDVDPYTDGVTIPDASVDRAYFIGGTTDATVQVQSKVPPGDYDVVVEANPASLGERATCTLPVEVKPVDVERLRYLVDTYLAAGEMTQWMADQLHATLDDAEAHLDAGETVEACAALKDVIALVGEYKDQEITPSASVDIETETKAFRTRLGCG